MAESVSISVFGDEIFRRKILAMRHRARHMGPILQEVGEDFLTAIEGQFGSEGSRGGTPWADLTDDWWMRRGSKHPILIHTSDMFLKLTDPDESINVTDDSVEILIPEEEYTKAASAQYGFTSRAGRSVAPRPWAVITDADRKAMRDKIADYLVHGDGA